MPRHDASKRVGFSPSPCFEPEEFKWPNTSFKSYLHEIKKGKPMYNHFAKKSLLVNMFPIQGKW